MGHGVLYLPLTARGCGKIFEGSRGLMSELRRDPIGGRWVIVDTDHPGSPEEFEYEPQVYRGGTCPFCYGNEQLTPPEIDAIRDPHTSPNTSGWQVREIGRASCRER